LSTGFINISLNGSLISKKKYHHSANITFSVDTTSEHSSKVDDCMKNLPLRFTSNFSDEVELVAECYVLNILSNGANEKLEGLVTKLDGVVPFAKRPAKQGVCKRSQFIHRGWIDDYNEAMNDTDRIHTLTERLVYALLGGKNEWLCPFAHFSRP
jgi:hypothetical protein